MVGHRAAMGEKLPGQHFCDCLWPDFNEAEMAKALDAFAHRERRFGGRDNDNDDGK